MDMARPWRRKLFIASLVVGTLAGVVFAISCSRQRGMDAALLSAIRRDDTPAALECLEAGANANAAAWIGPPTSSGTLLTDFGRRLRGRKKAAKGFHAPALYLVYLGWPGPIASLKDRR